MATKIAALAPGKYRPFVRWLNDTFGFDLFSNINFRRGFCVGGVPFTPQDALKLREMLDAEEVTQPEESEEEPLEEELQDALKLREMLDEEVTQPEESEEEPLEEELQDF